MSKNLLLVHARSGWVGAQADRIRIRICEGSEQSLRLYFGSRGVFGGIMN
jgi:hypothetical protein